MMLEQLCAHLHNYFTDPADVCAGTYTVEGGTIDLTDVVLNGQYFRVVGSALNDGVYQYPAEGLTDETFTGEIWPVRVPRAVLALADEIEAWQEKYGATMASPFQSESVIGVYSYTKASGGSGAGGSANAWKDVFKSRLNEWRKIR